MTDPEIPPALTPDEWRSKAYFSLFSAWMDGDRLMMGDGEEANAPDRHAVAALCLFGQRFGFTHADVRGLRMLAGAHPAFGGALDELAARIAALLPPMETP